MVEALENRQLLSLTIDVRASDGTNAVTVNSPGVVNLQVWAVIQGPTDPSLAGIQDLNGEFLGTNVGFGPVAGDLAAQNIAPFNAAGAATGTSQDLNGDGNKDVGGISSKNGAGWFFARSASMTTGAFQFEIATLTYTVNKINFGGEVDVSFALRPENPPSFTAIWAENGAGGLFSNETNGSVLPGAVVKITDVAAQPTGPITVADTSTAVTGQPDAIPVLQNDFDFPSSSHFVPSTVLVVTAPNQGGTAVVDPSTGNIDYTSAPTFFGTETFSYTVGDSNGLVSQPATVTVTVVPPVPTAVNDSAGTLANTPVTVNVLANDASPIGFNASSVTLTTQPANGTAVVNSDGTITYTPKSGFIGGDSLAYTATDNNATVSSIATVTLNVGVEISSAKGGNKSVAYTDADGTIGVVTLNRGVADVLFSGSGSFTSSHGKILVSGAGLGVAGINLSQTNAASTLVIHGGGGTGVVGVGGITDAAVLGHISAPAANLTGTVNLASVVAMQFSSALGATLKIGGGSPNVSINCGAINNSSITASSAALTLHSGSLTSSNISAAAGKSLQIAGNAVTSDMNFAGTVASVRITGGLSSNSSLVFGAGLGNLTVAGNISDSTVKAVGNISSLVASALTNDIITAGVTAGTTLATASTSNLGTNRIGNVRLTSKATAFANSSILANSIGSAMLGNVTTANNGTTEGLAAEQIQSVTLIENSTVKHLTAKQLVAPGVTFGDFEIEIK
jgi:hypothetical protein